MKQLILFLFYICQFYLVVSQDIATKEGKSIPLIINTNSNIITKLRSDEVKGSPMLSDRWIVGKVVFKNGRVIDSLLLQFNLESNKLLFRQQGLILEFVDTVIEAALKFNEPGITGLVIIRKYNTAPGKSHSPAYYLVLADGIKYQLLQWRTKKKVEQYSYGNNTTLTYMESDELFIFETATGEMHKIRAKKSAIQNALPGIRNEIEKICAENNFKIKDTNDLIELVHLLNGF